VRDSHPISEFGLKRVRRDSLPEKFRLFFLLLQASRIHFYSMRFKIILLLALAAAAIPALLLLKPTATPPPAGEAIQTAAAVTPPPAPTVRPSPSSSAPSPIPAFTSASQSTNDAEEAMEKEAAEIQAKIDRLEDLQANDDAESLHAILNELTDSNRVIRHAAIEATTQFRDRAAIPVLADLAARTTDPEEKQELLDAVEFLTLPTYTEVMAEKKRASRGVQ